MDSGFSYHMFPRKEYFKICRKQGIKTHLTASGMVIGVEFLESLWSKVCAKTDYLIDRCPFTRINFQAPMEVWSMNSVTNLI